MLENHHRKSRLRVFLENLDFEIYLYKNECLTVCPVYVSNPFAMKLWTVEEGRPLYIRYTVEVPKRNPVVLHWDDFQDKILEMVVLFQ